MSQHDSQENAKEFIVTSPHVMPCPIVQYHESRMQTMNANTTMNVNLKMNVIAVRHLQANKTSQHVKTHHERHIFMPVNQTIKN